MIPAAGDEAEGKLQHCSGNNYRRASQSCDRVKIRAQHRRNFTNEDVPRHAPTDTRERAEQIAATAGAPVFDSLKEPETAKNASPAPSKIEFGAAQLPGGFPTEDNQSGENSRPRHTADQRSPPAHGSDQQIASNAATGRCGKRDDKNAKYIELVSYCSLRTAQCEDECAREIKNRHECFHRCLSGGRFVR